MSPNKELPHVLVLPEDRANSKLADGFHLGIDRSRARQMQVLPEAGGWTEVFKLFRSEHAAKMDRYHTRFMVLLIDFDGDPQRLEAAVAKIPSHLADRVFVLGAWTNPENLKRTFSKSYEDIGTALAEDCRSQTDASWRNGDLEHNAEEIARLRAHVRPFLF